MAHLNYLHHYSLKIFRMALVDPRVFASANFSRIYLVRLPPELLRLIDRMINFIVSLQGNLSLFQEQKSRNLQINCSIAFPYFVIMLLNLFVIKYIEFQYFNSSIASLQYYLHIFISKSWSLFILLPFDWGFGVLGFWGFGVGCQCFEEWFGRK